MEFHYLMCRSIVCCDVPNFLKQFHQVFSTPSLPTTISPVALSRTWVKLFWDLVIRIGICLAISLSFGEGLLLSLSIQEHISLGLARLSSNELLMKASHLLFWLFFLVWALAMSLILLLSFTSFCKCTFLWASSVWRNFKNSQSCCNWPSWSEELLLSLDVVSNSILSTQTRICFWMISTSNWIVWISRESLERLAISFLARLDNFLEDIHWIISRRIRTILSIMR